MQHVLFLVQQNRRIKTSSVLVAYGFLPHNLIHSFSYQTLIYSSHFRLGSSLPISDASFLFFTFPFLQTAVQHERGPRNSTIRRQVAMYLKETSELNSVLAPHPFRSPFLPAYMGYEHLSDGVTVTALEPGTPPAPVTTVAATTAMSSGIIMQPLPKVRGCTIDGLHG